MYLVDLVASSQKNNKKKKVNESIETHSTFWIPRKSYTTILEPAWYSASGFLRVKQTQFSGVARGSRFDSLRFENAASNQQFFSLEIRTLKLIAASITIRLKKKTIYTSNIW